MKRGLYIEEIKRGLFFIPFGKAASFSAEEWTLSPFWMSFDASPSKRAWLVSPPTTFDGQP